MHLFLSEITSLYIICSRSKRKKDVKNTHTALRCDNSVCNMQLIRRRQRTTFPFTCKKQLSTQIIIIITELIKFSETCFGLSLFVENINIHPQNLRFRFDNSLLREFTLKWKRVSIQLKFKYTTLLN